MAASDHHSLFLDAKHRTLVYKAPIYGWAMLVKVISLMFDSVHGNFDDTPLRDFLKDKEIISISDHFFVKNDIPYLTVVTKYYPYRQEVEPALAQQGKRDESWRETLSEMDMGIFNRLREWRSTRSRQDGVPPYILFTNKQLAQIAKNRPNTISDLESIEGVGRGKTDKYGKDVLELTAPTKEGVGLFNNE